MKREKKITELIILIHIIFLLVPSFSFGISWFEKEKEIEDEYLTRLFAPEPMIGRYPESKLIEMIRLPSGNKKWIYVSKYSLKKIYDYYEAKVKHSLKDAYGFPFAKEMFDDPKAYSRNPIRILGVKTTGRIVWIHGFNQIPGQKWNSIKVNDHQSLDPNLTGFVEIEIRED